MCTRAEQTLQKGSVSACHLGWDSKGFVSGHAKAPSCLPASRLPRESSTVPQMDGRTDRGDPSAVGRRVRAAVEGARMAARGFWLIRSISMASCKGDERYQHPTLPLVHPEWGGTRGLGAVGTCCPALPFLSGPSRRSSVSTRFADIFCFPSRLQSQTDCLVYLPRVSTSLYKIDVCAYQMYTEAESSPRLAGVHQSAPFPVKPKLVQLGGQRGPSAACARG